MQDFYTMLKLAANASEDDIRNAIQREMRRWSIRANSAALERRREAERMLETLEEAERVLLNNPGISHQSEQGNAALVERHDVNSHSLGVLTIDEMGSERNSIILPKDTPLPCQASYMLMTVIDNQPEMHFQITERESEDPAHVSIIGEAAIALPPSPQGAPFEVRFEYDANGNAHISVYDLSTNTMLGEMKIVWRTNKFMRNSVV